MILDFKPGNLEGSPRVLDRVFVEGQNFAAPIAVRGEEHRHLARVRRHGPGDLVEVFDGRGHAHTATIISVEKNQSILQANSEPLPGRESACVLTLLTAVPKGDRFDWLVEKAVELGVRRLVPTRFDRSVVDPRESKLDRLRRLVIEASKQCGRNLLMEICPPQAWSELVHEMQTPVRWLADPGGTSPRVDTLPQMEAVVAIGPEGGLTSTERRLAEESGWETICLGPTILRIETAALSACANLLTLTHGALGWKEMA